jgi:copper(I)-binding protein
LGVRRARWRAQRHIRHTALVAWFRLRPRRDRSRFRSLSRSRDHVLKIATVTFLAAAGLFTFSPAHAQSSPKTPIEVVQPWARASGGTTGAVYLTLKNGGNVDDKLVAASTPAADKTELHSMRMEGDVMKMRPVHEIPVKAHGSAELKPGGLHVMLMGLKAPWKEGDKIAVTLKFEKAGEVNLEVPVLAVSAGQPGAMPAIGGMHMNQPR